MLFLAVVIDFVLQLLRLKFSLRRNHPLVIGDAEIIFKDPLPNVFILHVFRCCNVM